MNQQHGAKTVDDLLSVIENLSRDMQEFSGCENIIREINIVMDDDNDFLITSE